MAMKLQVIAQNFPKDLSSLLFCQT